MAKRGFRRAFITLVAICFCASPARAMDLVELVKKIENSVVRLDTNRSTGSGVIVDDRGWILTNHHVVRGASQCTVTLRSGTMLKAEGYLALLSHHDLALIKTAPFDKPSAIALAGDLPKIGERVAAFGNPRGFSFTTSEGIVSAIRSGNDVIETIGRDIYDDLGYSADATWVQTTAPISPGNSGGPLVTMSGELVALNTWVWPGQNLNFGISISNIRRLLGTVSPQQPPKHFSEMPKIREKTVTRRPNEPTEPTRPYHPVLSFELPTGRLFSYAVFDAEPVEFIKSLSESSNDAVVLRHPNGALYASADQQKGLLHGVTLGQYETRQKMAIVNYVKGQRHGLMLTWKENGEPAMFGQFANGKPVGFVAWHEDGDLRMLLQYSPKQLEWLQLVSGDSPAEGFKTREEAEKNETAKDLLTKLEAFDESIKKNEQKLRRNARQLDEQQRRAIASKLGPEKRKMASARAAARDAQDAAAMRDWFRKSLGK